MSLTVAKWNAQRLLHLVGDLLRIATDAMTINTRHADLSEVVNRSVEAAQPRAQAGVLTLNLIHNGTATGHFDPDRLSQAIDNLISNAIKFTPTAAEPASQFTPPARAPLRGHQHRSRPKHDELDQGFTRFFRAANARSSTIPGGGLGLAITKTIMENQRGHVVFSSSPGQGTTAALTLPAAYVEALNPAPLS